VRTPCLIAALTVLTLVVSCEGRGDPTIGSCSPIRERYFGDRFDDTFRHFQEFDLETRYRIFICAKRGMPWPGLEFGIEFAEGGAEVGAFLAGKLQDTTYDLTIYDIVVVFALMQSMQTYDATTDPALMTLIEQKVEQLDGALREYGEEYVETIRGGPGTPLPS
jgi:hypothetical protein